VRQNFCREKCARLQAPVLPALPLLFGVDLIDSISIYATKTLSAGKTFRAKRKTRHMDRVFSLIQENLAMVMTMVTTMMGGVSRNNGPSQNDERNGSKKQSAQLHDKTPP
jgi:hypothetical protein